MCKQAVLPPARARPTAVGTVTTVAVCTPASQTTPGAPRSRRPRRAASRHAGPTSRCAARCAPSAGSWRSQWCLQRWGCQVAGPSVGHRLHACGKGLVLGVAKHTARCDGRPAAQPQMCRPLCGHPGDAQQSCCELSCSTLPPMQLLATGLSTDSGRAPCARAACCRPPGGATYRRRQRAAAPACRSGASGSPPQSYPACACR